MGVGSTTLIVMPFFTKNAIPGDTKSFTLSRLALSIMSPLFTCALTVEASSTHAKTVNKVRVIGLLAPSRVDGFASEDRRRAGRAFESARRRKVPRKRPGGYGDGEACRGDEPPGQSLMREEIGGRPSASDG